MFNKNLCSPEDVSRFNTAVELFDVLTGYNYDTVSCPHLIESIMTRDERIGLKNWLNIFYEMRGVTWATTWRDDWSEELTRLCKIHNLER